MTRYELKKLRESYEDARHQVEWFIDDIERKTAWIASLRGQPDKADMIAMIRERRDASFRCLCDWRSRVELLRGELRQVGIKA